MKLYTEQELRDAIKYGQNYEKMDKGEIPFVTDDEFINSLTSIELPSDEEIESKYNKFIDTEIQLGFLKQEQGERLNWYYKTYFIDKIQGGNNEQQ